MTRNFSSRVKVLRHLTMVCLLALGAACGSGDPAATTDAGPTGGTLIVAEPTDVRTLYPPMANRSFDLAVIHSMYNRLAEIGDDLNTLSDSGYTPSLADSWEWATDSLSIAFKIHPKARWHDGQPVRAEDVRFTFRAYTDITGLSVNGGYLSNIDSVSVRDSLTAVAWFKRRKPQQFFDATYHMYVLPAHRLSVVPIAELGHDSLSRSPVGSGRFRFVGREENQRIETEADTGNFRGRANLDRVTWEVSGNLQSATLSVFGGNSDFFYKLQPEDLAQAAKATDLKIVPYLQAGYTFMSFNLKANGDSTKPHPIFDDVRVRRALSMAVDRAVSARAVLDSFATPSFGPSPRMMFRNAESLKQVEFDIAHAKALLDSAGWTMAPGQTVRSKGGVPLSFEILVPNTSKPRMTYGVLLSDQFRGIGVTATPRNAETSVIGPAAEGGNFDTYIGTLTVTPGLKGVSQSWGTAGVHGLNYGWYSNPRFDATLDSALAEFKQAKSRALWVRAYQIILDDAPAIWLYEERSIGVMHRRIHPAVLRADAWYANLADWTVDPALRIPRDNQGRGAR